MSKRATVYRAGAEPHPRSRGSHNRRVIALGFPNTQIAQTQPAACSGKQLRRATPLKGPRGDPWRRGPADRTRNPRLLSQPTASTTQHTTWLMLWEWRTSLPHGEKPAHTPRGRVAKPNLCTPRTGRHKGLCRKGLAPSESRAGESALSRTFVSAKSGIARKNTASLRAFVCWW